MAKRGSFSYLSTKKSFILTAGSGQLYFIIDSTLSCTAYESHSCASSVRSHIDSDKWSVPDIRINRISRYIIEYQIYQIFAMGKKKNDTPKEKVRALFSSSLNISLVIYFLISWFKFSCKYFADQSIVKYFRELVSWS